MPWRQKHPSLSGSYSAVLNQPLKQLCWRFSVLSPSAPFTFSLSWTQHNQQVLLIKKLTCISTFLISFTPSLSVYWNVTNWYGQGHNEESYSRSLFYPQWRAKRTSSRMKIQSISAHFRAVHKFSGLKNCKKKKKKERTPKISCKLFHNCHNRCRWLYRL